MPAIVFLVSCFIAFSTGTSWGTFAIMISIAVPMAHVMGTDPSVGHSSRYRRCGYLAITVRPYQTPLSSHLWLQPATM
ncbi:Na+/H+ antiporter NhaC family protein [Reichenbachiella ulvae]|uniref:Na+/H+ antiporter NhaC family protein n=1 Tax=Reichenbachiella ulvae TaxID=2980104 RepID=UPI00384F9B3C